MNATRKYSERERCCRAISVWDNEGGAPAGVMTGDQYGRRIEGDRSWTVYHVFSGIPANPGGQIMIGLSRSLATGAMQRLNRDAGRQYTGMDTQPQGRPAKDGSGGAQP
jgi:hypothetical protein